MAARGSVLIHDSLRTAARRFPIPAGKRLFDIAGACLLALPLVPLLAVAALRLRASGPILYLQWREGRGGRWFRICKLRTMHPGADARLARHLAESPEARRQWDHACKLHPDPRVLGRFAEFLRRTGLDELPQVWNVLRGDMSLVGPRPLPGYHLERYPADFRELRRLVRPGLTGPWQLSGGGIERQIELETAYIERQSIRLDFQLIGQTAWNLLQGLRRRRTPD
jgi:lipopolysaccharide/colanic/teichoic acid biosynthesis glycosyltransferase